MSQKQFTVGNGENTGYDSSELGPLRTAISELGGDPYDICWWSKYPSNETVNTADIGEGAWAFKIETLRPKSDGSSDPATSSSIGVW